MKISVDPDKCQGHSRCYALAPELFDVDDYGNATALNDGDVPSSIIECYGLVYRPATDASE